MPNQWVVETATAVDTSSLANLLLASAPSMLSQVLGNGDTAKTVGYLNYSLAASGGQYGYQNHSIIKQGQKIIGIASAWHDQLPASFDKITVESLHHFFGIEACVQIFKRSAALALDIQKPTAKQLVIGHLSTLSGYQRRGVASAFIQHFYEQAKLLGKPEIIVDVEKQNQSALQCYLKLGFQPLSSDDNDRYVRLSKPVIDDAIANQ